MEEVLGRRDIRRPVQPAIQPARHPGLRPSVSSGDSVVEEVPRGPSGGRVKFGPGHSTCLRLDGRQGDRQTGREDANVTKGFVFHCRMCKLVFIVIFLMNELVSSIFSRFNCGMSLYPCGLFRTQYISCILG